MGRDRGGDQRRCQTLGGVHRLPTGHIEKEWQRWPWEVTGDQMGLLDLIKIVQYIPLAAWPASPCHNEKRRWVQNPVQCKSRLGRRSSGSGRASFHCGEFLGCEGSEKTQGDEEAEECPQLA